MRILLLFLLSFPAIAVPLPEYIGEVSGIAMHTMKDMDLFKLNPGRLTQCTQDLVADWRLYDCDAEGVQVTMGEGLFSRSEYKKVRVWIRPYKNDMIYEYTFRGNWEQTEKGYVLKSKSLISLWRTDKEPNRWRGSISLLDFGKYATIEAVSKVGS